MKRRPLGRISFRAVDTLNQYHINHNSGHGAMLQKDKAQFQQKTIKILVIDTQDDFAKDLHHLLSPVLAQCHIYTADTLPDPDDSYSQNDFDIILMSEYSSELANVLAAHKHPLPVVLVDRRGQYDQLFNQLDEPLFDYLSANEINTATLVRLLRHAVCLNTIRRQHIQEQGIAQRIRELTESEARLRTIVDATSDCIKIVSDDGRLAYMNAAGWSMVETGPEVLQDVCAFDLIAPECRETWIRNHHRVCQGEKLNWEFDIIGFRGTRRTMETHAVPLPGPDGKVAHLAITRDISERKRTEEALARQYKLTREYARQLEASNQDLTQFASVVSHDLQAPLRKLTIFGDFLKNKEAQHLSSEAQDYINRMHQSILRMQALITALLTLSRVDRQINPFTLTDFKHVVSTALEDLSVEIQKTNAKIHLGSMCAFEADSQQMVQMIINLTGNALKYRRPDVMPEINISCTEQDSDKVRIVVTDNGIGIKEEHYEKIFEIFHRLHPDHEYPGTGIGLAIVKRIIDRHNGSIQVDSVIGEGTAFIITLPIKQ